MMLNFHTHFRLNNTKFNSVTALLNYSKTQSEDIHNFLEDWFSKEDFIIANTSGSTGKPKPIQLKKKLMINSALATADYFNLKAHTTALLCLPVKYIAGKMMLVRALTLGWHIDVVAPNSSPLKGVKKTYDFSAMVPLQVKNSLAKLHLIKKLIVGGGVVSHALQNKLQNSATIVFATYGMTETITHIAVKQLNNTTLLPNVYTTLPNVNIYKDARNCLVLSAPNVSKTTVFTNDVVNLISDKQFEWLGRYDNVINSGGIKLQPEVIENALAPHIATPFFVIGMSDVVLGEKMVLCIEQKANDKEKAQLFKKIKVLKSLTTYQIPKDIYFITPFLRTETNKIKRQETLKAYLKK